MLNRLTSYFVIVAVIIFTAVQGFAIAKHVRVQTGLTTPDYIRVITILIALLGVVVVLRSLTPNKRSRLTKQIPSPLRAPRSFGDAVRLVSASSIRHPALTPLLIVSFMIIPVGLCAVEKPHGWNDFSTRDWILIGIAEMPFTLLTIFSVIVSWKSIAKKLTSKSQSEQTRL
jgi:hypothetical protein